MTTYLGNHFHKRHHVGRAAFASALANLEPSTEDEHNAQLGLLDAIATNADGERLRKAKLRFRDAMLLGTWQSPALGARDGTGTLQGPPYASRYERETIDPGIIEAALQKDSLQPLLFRSAASAVLVCSHIDGDLAGRLGNAGPIGTLAMLDQEMAAIWLPIPDSDNALNLRRRLVDARRLGAAPTILQLISAYLEMEILPATAWCRHRSTEAMFPKARLKRINAVHSRIDRSRADLVANCEKVIAEAHLPYLNGGQTVDCVVTSSGMAALTSIISIANEFQPKGERVALGIGKSCYFENRLAVDYFAAGTDVYEFDERDPLPETRTASVVDREVLMLMEPVSNCARTTFIGPQTGWTIRRSHDLPVADVAAFLRSLTSGRGSRCLTLAIDSSMSGPGPWLRPIIEAVKETGARLIVWSSLQKHFMSGEDWSPGGFILNIDSGGPETAFPTQRLRQHTDLSGISDEAFALVAQEASHSSDRAQRIGAAAEWLASQLENSSIEVLHPASRLHPDRQLWHRTQRPSVPFVFLRLGYTRAKLFRAALASSGQSLDEVLLERDSFGFSQPTISDLFPGQPDEIVRISPGDPADVPTASVLEVIRNALNEVGL